MKRFFALSMMLAVTVSTGTFAAEPPARMRLPWERLERLLGIADSEIRLTWDEFHLLLQRQTPEYHPDYRMEAGSVILSRDEFNQLINSFKSVDRTTPGPYLKKGSYRVKVEKNGLRVDARIDLDVSSVLPDGRASITLLPGQIGIESIRVNGEPGILEESNGQILLILPRPGAYQAALVYCVPKEKQAAFQVGFPIVQTPLTEMEVEILEGPLEIQIAGSLLSEKESGPGRSRVKAVLPPTNFVQLSWHPLAAQRGQGPARLYAEGQHLLSVEDSVLRVRSQIVVQALRGTVDHITVLAPPGFSVLQVEGESVSEWHETSSEPAKIEINLSSAHEGSIPINLVAERALATDRADIEFPGFPVQGALRDRGYVAVELAGSSEVRDAKSEKLERVDLRELPPAMLTVTTRPLLYAYRYLAPAYQLSLDVEHHGSVATLSAVIDEAYVTSQLMESGRRLNRILYRVRNNGKQFLELALPAKARLWSVFVSDRPVKPTLNKEGKILVPLDRSTIAAGGSLPFDVEILYYEEAWRFWPIGGTKLELPRPDLMVSRIHWTLRAPAQRSYLGWGWGLEREEPLPQVAQAMAAVPEETEFELSESAASNAPMAQLRAFAGPTKKMLLKRKDDQKMAVLEERATLNALSTPRLASPPRGNERGLFDALAGGIGGRVSGVLPVKVNFPEFGILRIWTQTLPDPSRPMQLFVVHLSAVLVNLAKLILAIMVLSGFWRARVKITGILRTLRGHLPAMPHWTLAWTPARLTLAAALTAAVASCVSFWLGIFAVGGFLFLLTRWLLGLLPRGGERT